MRARLAVLSVALVALPLGLAPAAASARQPDPGRMAAQRLAEKFAPVMMIREQLDPPCDNKEEQYRPTTVDVVLDNPEVELQRLLPGGGLKDIKAGPSAADLAGLGENYFLNLPGSPLGNTCVYAKDFAAIRAGGDAPLIIHARIGREAGYSGFALQFWFYWYFNQFNDLHESDWEGMQLIFESETPAEALRSGEEPDEMILYQHAGGERAEWDDSKVQKDGNHPVVFPAAGSHATFYGSAIWVENGQNGSGVGCDVTTAPLETIRPKPVLMPGEATQRGDFSWLSYEGHWGQNAKGFNIGPTGPAMKAQWATPFSWMERQRSTSPRLPGGSIVGPQVTEAFCGAVADVSKLMNLEGAEKALALGILAALLILIVVLAIRTTWRPVDLRHLRARRAFGQLVLAAIGVYARNWRVLVPIGLMALPIVGLTQFVGNAVSGDQTLDDAAGREGANLAFGDFVNTIGPPVAGAMIAALVILFLRELVEKRPAGLGDAIGGLRQRFWRVVFAQVAATLGVVALAVTVIGIPFAVNRYVAWLFVQQEVLFTDKSLREAFRGSAEIVRGRWWYTVRVAGFFWLVSVVVGPALGFALIFTDFSLLAINLLGSLIFALIIPFVATGRTLLYFDLGELAVSEPARPRSWAPWRPRRFGRRPGPVTA